METCHIHLIKEGACKLQVSIYTTALWQIQILIGRIQLYDNNQPGGAITRMSSLDHLLSVSLFMDYQYHKYKQLEKTCSYDEALLLYPFQYKFCNKK